MAKKKSDELVSIDTLKKEFDSVSLVETLEAENKILKLRISELEALVNSVSPRGSEVVKVEITTEQLICEVQIQKLQDKACQRELTLEETKRLEILVRSLYLIKDKGAASLPTDFSVLPANTSIAQLEAIASTPEVAETVE